jgi:predicted aconitase with swiveling domain
MGSEIEILVPGEAAGTVIRLEEPLSFWGGFDPATGTIIDQRHPQLDVNLTGHILAMEYGRGSSSSTGVLAEAIRLGTAPSGIILAQPDLIVMLGALVANELYSKQCPVVVVDRATFETLVTGMAVEIIDGGASIRARTTRNG